MRHVLREIAQTEGKSLSWVVNETIIDHFRIRRFLHKIGRAAKAERHVHKKAG